MPEARPSTIEYEYSRDYEGSVKNATFEQEVELLRKGAAIFRKQPRYEGPVTRLLESVGRDPAKITEAMCEDFVAKHNAAFQAAMVRAIAIDILENPETLH